MKHYNDLLIRQNDATNSTDGSDNVQPATKVYIALAGTRNLASLYDGEDINTASAITNPITTDNYGRMSFYVEDGDYDFYINFNTDVEFKVKSSEPIYDVRSATANFNHSTATNRSAVGAHDDIYIRAKTLSQTIAEDAPAGTRYLITDLNNARYDVVLAADSGGVYLPLSANKKLKLIVSNKTASIDSIIYSGSDAYQAFVDIESSSEIETVELSIPITVSQDLTINKNLIINKGGLITPASGVTVTLKATPTANNNGYKIFDTSSGGSFAVTSDNEISEIQAHWFGITGYSDVEAIARSNMKAIADALSMAGSLGVGVQAIGRAPTVRLPRLIFTIDAPIAGASVGAVIESYVKLTGYGDNTYVNVRPSADAFDIFKVTSAGANSVVIDGFQIDGNYASQTNLQNAIVFETTGSPAIYCEVGGDTLYIKEMSGWGIWIKGKGLNDSTINPKVVRDNGRNALYVSACDSLIVRGSYRTSKTIYANMLFESTNVYCANLDGVTSREAGGANLWVSNINPERGRVRMDGGVLENAGTSGAILDRAYRSGLFNVSTFRNENHGVEMIDCVGTSVIGGNSDVNKQRGLSITRCNNCVIGGGISINSNSDTNPNVYDGITAFTSDKNQFGEIMIRNFNGTQRYGLVIDDAPSDANIISALVDARGSGNTGDILDNGTGTIGVEKIVSGLQTVTVPSFGNFTFTITNASVKTNDMVTQIKSTQLDSLIYTATVKSGSVDVHLFNNTNAAINITNLNIDVYLISG